MTVSPHLCSGTATTKPREASSMQKAEYSVLEIQEGTEKSDQMSGSLLGPIPSTRSTTGHLKRLNGGSFMCSSPSQGSFSTQNALLSTKSPPPGSTCKPIHAVCQPHTNTASRPPHTSLSTLTATPATAFCLYLVCL